MIAILVVLLVAVLAFIAYWVATSKSRQSGGALGSSASKSVPRTGGNGSRKVALIEDDDDDGTKVRVAGPRLIRTMGGLNVGDEMPVGSGITIGRGQQCSVSLHDQEMSAMHAEFRIENGQPVVIDLGSTNGTYVNGEQVAPNILTPLKDGDQIRLGMTSLVFKDPR
jgi:pSer/pThr/pTyr-binding forkhead associated (FHA) protein